MKQRHFHKAEDTYTIENTITSTNEPHFKFLSPKHLGKQNKFHKTSNKIYPLAKFPTINTSSHIHLKILVVDSILQTVLPLLESFYESSSCSLIGQNHVVSSVIRHPSNRLHCLVMKDFHLVFNKNIKCQLKPLNHDSYKHSCFQCSSPST